METSKRLVSRLSRARPLVERHGTGNASRICAYRRPARTRVDLQLLGDVGLSEAESRSVLDEGALFGSRLIFGWHFPSATGKQPYLLYVTRSHVDLEFAAAQLVLEMLAQRLLVDLELIGDFGLGDANGRSVLDERALVCGRPFN